MPNKVSENIRKVWQKKGIYENCLSKETDLPLNTVFKKEIGGSPNPAIETLEKIAKYFGVSVAALFKI